MCVYGMYICVYIYIYIHVPRGLLLRVVLLALGVLDGAQEVVVVEVVLLHEGLFNISSYMCLMFSC